jgi:hypothetical protein
MERFSIFARNDRLPARLAAGPLEDLIHYHGPEIIAEMEVRSRCNPEFRHLLGGVWESGTPEIWTRIQKVQGKVWCSGADMVLWRSDVIVGQKRDHIHLFLIRTLPQFDCNNGQSPPQGTCIMPTQPASRLEELLPHRWPSQ